MPCTMPFITLTLRELCPINSTRTSLKNACQWFVYKIHSVIIIFWKAWDILVLLFLSINAFSDNHHVEQKIRNSSASQIHRKLNLLLLVLVLLEWLCAALESLSHQRFSCNLSSIESIHLLLQFPSFLLQSLLFFLVHPLELLKPLMKLETMRVGEETMWDKPNTVYFQSGVILWWCPSSPLFPFLSALPLSPSLCWQTSVSFPPLFAADPQGTPSSWPRMSPEGWRSG